MNSRRVVIKCAFAALKDRWKILKKFPDKIDKAAREALACCILHNFCGIRQLSIATIIPIKSNNDLLMGFEDPVPYLTDGGATKGAGKAMKDDLFVEWPVKNPPSPPLQHLPLMHRIRSPQLVLSG
jgi:hypothetical protein